jgi:hypothetical protein
LLRHRLEHVEAWAVAVEGRLQDLSVAMAAVEEAHLQYSLEATVVEAEDCWMTLVAMEAVEVAHWQLAAVTVVQEAMGHLILLAQAAQAVKSSAVTAVELEDRHRIQH